MHFSCSFFNKNAMSETEPARLLPSNRAGDWQGGTFRSSSTISSSNWDLSSSIVLKVKTLVLSSAKKNDIHVIHDSIMNIAFDYNSLTVCLIYHWKSPEWQNLSVVWIGKVMIPAYLMSNCRETDPSSGSSISKHSMCTICFVIVCTHLSQMESVDKTQRSSLLLLQIPLFVSMDSPGNKWLNVIISTYHAYYCVGLIHCSLERNLTYMYCVYNTRIGW